MNVMNKLEFYIRRLIESVNLERDKKTDLIGHLFVVGSILAALTGLMFTTSPKLIPVYGSWWILSWTFFIYFSVVYYIFIQKDTSKTNVKRITNLFALLVAFTFSSLFSLNLLIVLGSELLYLLYAFSLALFLYFALMEL